MTATTMPKSREPQHTKPDAASVAAERKGFAKRWITIIAAAGLVVGMLFVPACSTKARAGPNGGDLVTLGDGKTSAEVVANSDTGEAMVHTWNQDLKSALPLASGHHEFKFIVDGQWCCEPGCQHEYHGCPKCCANEFGTMNRVLEVQ